MIDFHLKAHEYIGVPFKHLGRSRSGLDCAGLVICSAIDAGYSYDDSVRYSKSPSVGLLLSSVIDAMGEPVDDDPRINDVVVFNLPGGRGDMHIGVITHHPDGLGIIHADPSHKKVVYHRLSEKMAANIAGVFRWVF